MEKYLQEQIGLYTKRKACIQITKAKSYFLAVRKEKKQITIFLHAFFIKAPYKVLDALARYIAYKKAQDYMEVKKFIHFEQSALDYTATFDRDKCITQGKFYCLRTLYEKVNTHFFQDKFCLHISWFFPKYRTFRSVTFGSYERAFKLIKINQYLDHPKVPSEYMQYLIFHEMLHELYPTKINERGRHQIHTPEFKRHEKTFPNYEKQKQFEKYFLKNFWRKSWQDTVNGPI